jgi:hypothetical protein
MWVSENGWVLPGNREGVFPSFIHTNRSSLGPENLSYATTDQTSIVTHSLSLHAGKGSELQLDTQMRKQRRENTHRGDPLTFHCLKISSLPEHRPQSQGWVRFTGEWCWLYTESWFLQRIKGFVLCRWRIISEVLCNKIVINTNL